MSRYSLLALVLALALLCAHVHADVYMHNPRGSNNRLRERSANRENGDRLFDSQNNNRGGYNVGVRGHGNNGQTSTVQDAFKSYNPTTATFNTLYKVPFSSLNATSDGLIYPMVFYEGSVLPIEWTNQHGCGGNENGDPQLTNCQMLIQFTCDTDDGAGVADADLAMRVRIKDGENTNTPPQQNTFADAKAKDADANEATGRHESSNFYWECTQRRRNPNLFTADQKLQGDRARFTRQNPGGNRRGYECPEERDYYPYWHPSPWIDVAVLTDNTNMCNYYKTESLNKATRGRCFYNDTSNTNALNNAVRARTVSECSAANGVWKTYTHNVDAPFCGQAPWSRDNHLGNTKSDDSKDVNPSRYSWTLPTLASLSQATGFKAKLYDNEYARCVVRLRYNISTDDYDPWKTNSTSNENRNANIASPVEENPEIDIGVDNQALRLAINTAQFGRTFQDRSHSFMIRKRPASLPASTKIYNLNVRGKRGNIVQTFPAVEYDFIPDDITVGRNDFLHIQWTGSNTHNNGHPAGDGQAGDAGEGTGGTDRSNLVSFPDRISNYPIPNLQYGTVAPNTLLSSAVCYEGVDGFPQSGTATSIPSFDCQVQLASSGYYVSKNELESTTRNMDPLLNNGEATLPGGILMKVNQAGTFHYGCTRNNNFSNRSQKGVIRST